MTTDPLPRATDSQHLTDPGLPSPYPITCVRGGGEAVDERPVEVEEEPLGPIHDAMLRAGGAPRRSFPRTGLVATLAP